MANKDSKNNDIQKDSYAFALYRRIADGSMYIFDRPKKRGVLRQHMLEDYGSGYLLLSDQGDSGMKVPSSVKIYKRQGDNKFVKTVFTTDGRRRGDQLETDRLDVTSVPLPPLFPNGFVITHDGFHSAFNLYKWEDFAQDDLATGSSGVC